MLKGDKIDWINHHIDDKAIRRVAKLVASVSAESGLSHADVIAVIVALEGRRANDIEIDKYNTSIENDHRANMNVRMTMAAE